MYKKIESKKQLLLISTILTFIFYLLTNGYRFFNTMFSGDSLLMIYQNDNAWQIALGRFVQPFIIFLRGGVLSPFTISIISIIWVSLAVYFLVDFLEINNLYSIVFIVAAMICNTTVLAGNATFLPTVDCFALALFFAVFGVWNIKKGKLLSILLGIFSLCLSLGTYQAYICVAITLVMIHFLLKMLKRPTFKDTFKSALKYILSFLAAAVIYYIIWKIFQKIFNIWTSDSYNGLASVGDYSDTNIGSLLATTYKIVVNYFIHPETFTTTTFRGVSLSIFWVYILRFCNIAVFAVMIITLIRLNLKSKTNLWQRIIQLLIIVAFPLGINFVCLISKGMVHTLMVYAFCLVYILTIKITEMLSPCSEKVQSPKKSYIPWIAVISAVTILSWSSLVYANQVYLKKDLQDKAAHSLMTRIVYEIESTEGYVAGTTPVAFFGSFEINPYITDIEVFKDVLPYGMGKSSLLYVGTDYAYLTYILNVNMNLTRVSSENEFIQDMPLYPADGSIAYVDDILVVKISDY